MGSRHIRFLAIAALCAITIALAVAFRRYAVDDAFITYRYAENLAQGRGFVYNLSENVLSTTAPLYAVLLAGFSWLGIDLPTVSNLIGVCSLGGAAILLYLTCERFGQRLAGGAGSLLLLLSPGLLRTVGLETNFSLLLILGGLYLYVSNRSTASAIPLALALLVRPDAILVEALILAHSLLMRRRLPWRQIGLYAVIVLPFAAYLFVLFGSPLPVTLEAKQAQLQGNWDSYLAGLRPWLRAYFGSWGLAALAALAAIVGLGAALRRRGWALILVLWAVLYAAAYQALGVAAYDWYYAPLVPAFALLAGLGIEAIVRVRARAPAAVLGVVAPAVLLWGQAGSLWETGQVLPDGRAVVYRQAGEWLQREAPGESTVGVMEVGIMGYYARLPMLDFLGLIRPETVAALKRGDIAWSLARYQPDYVVLTGVNPLWMYDVGSDQWFRESYAAVARFAHDGFWGSPLTIYKRLQPAGAEASVALWPQTFGDKVALRSYRLPQEAQAGSFVALDMRWKALRPVDESFALSVHLINADGRILSQSDARVAAKRWAPGEDQDYRFMLKAPQGAAPGRYAIRVSVYSPETRKQWSVKANGGEFVILPESIAITDRVDSTGAPPLARFGDGLSLVGYEIDRPRASPGELLTVTLHWTSEQIAGKLGARIELLSGDGRLAAYTWSALEPEQRLALPPLPEDLPPDRYRLRLTVYETDSGKELEALGPFGLPPLTGALILDEINVD